MLFHDKVEVCFYGNFVFGVWKTEPLEFGCEKVNSTGMCRDLEFHTPVAGFCKLVMQQLRG